MAEGGGAFQWSLLVAPILGATLGFVSAFTIAYVNARITAYVQSYKNVSDKVVAAANLASEYWLMTFESIPLGGDLPEDDDERQIHLDAALLEAKILGMQEQILALDVHLRYSLSKSLTQKIDTKMMELLDGLSGYPFGERNGNAEKTKSIAVQKAAAGLVGLIHSATGEQAKLPSYFKWLTKN